MFQRANIAFVDEIVHRLKTVFVCTGDTICYQGEIAKPVFVCTGDTVCYQGEIARVSQTIAPVNPVVQRPYYPCQSNLAVEKHSMSIRRSRRPVPCDHTVQRPCPCRSGGPEPRPSLSQQHHGRTLGANRRPLKIVFKTPRKEN
eukprot:1178047-Prorocentrum_minimum.AAC.6